MGFCGIKIHEIIKQNYLLPPAGAISVSLDWSMMWTSLAGLPPGQAISIPYTGHSFLSRLGSSFSSSSLGPRHLGPVNTRATADNGAPPRQRTSDRNTMRHSKRAAAAPLSRTPTNERRPGRGCMERGGVAVTAPVTEAADMSPLFCYMIQLVRKLWNRYSVR